MYQRSKLLCVCLMNFSGDEICSRNDPGERGAITGMSTAAAQLETGVKLHEARRHSAADGAHFHGRRLDVVFWKVSVDII